MDVRSRFLWGPRLHTNVYADERSALLVRASCVLYTPSNEHFGIVPVEAMCCGAPVVAVNSGEMSRDPSSIDSLYFVPPHGSRLWEVRTKHRLCRYIPSATSTTLPLKALVPVLH